MSSNEKIFRLFDFGIWSAIVKRKRKDRGYVTAEDFSNKIESETKVHISVQTLYKIEQGKKEPSLLQFWAINIVIYGQLMPFDEITNICFTNEGKEILEHVHI